jgi:uncharacterized membrane protein YoaK (UPF0700 family)
MSDVLQPRPRPVPRLVPPLLGFVAGFVDSCTVLALFGLVVAQVTGSFVLAAAASVVTVVAERHGRRALVWALGLECIVLTGFMITAIAGEPLADPNSLPVVIASLTGLFAMGAQSAMVRLTMKGVASTNVMTTNTTQIAIDATELLLAWRARRRVPADDAVAAAYLAARGRIATLAPIMLAFLLGTAAGTVGYVLVGLRTLIVPLAIMYGLLAWARARRPAD